MLECMHINGYDMIHLQSVEWNKSGLYSCWYVYTVYISTAMIHLESKPVVGRNKPDL